MSPANWSASVDREGGALAKVFSGLFGGGKSQAVIVDPGPPPTSEDPEVQAARRRAKSAELQASGRAASLLGGATTGDASPFPFERATLKQKLGE